MMRAVPAMEELWHNQRADLERFASNKALVAIRRMCAFHFWGNVSIPPRAPPLRGHGVSEAAGILSGTQ